MAGILSGKVALVTGGGSGIGRGIAEAFSREGAVVAISGRREALVKSEATALSKASGSKTLGIAGDVSKPADAKRMVEQTVQTFGRLDILVNNAGIYRGGTVDGTPDDDIASISAINLNGPIFLCKYAYPHLKKHKDGSGAWVINISTSATLARVPNMAVYAASKAGLNNLSQNLAKEWGSDKIRVNAICPGVVESPIFETVMTKEAAEKALVEYAKYHPLGRVGQPEDIARMALFLAGPGGDWITGIVMPVDGGIGLG